MPNIPTSGQFGGQIWGAGNAQPAGAAVCDVQASLLDCLYRLGFQPAGDIGASSWVTPAELLQFADDMAKKLTSEHELFIQWDTTIAIVAGTALYGEPAAHIATILAAFFPAAGPVQILRITSQRDLWALDGNWVTTSGNPTRLSLDAGGVGTCTVYPNPLAGGTLGQVLQEWPAAFGAGATTIAVPVVLQDLFTYAMLAGAKGKESDHSDMEMAKHYQQRADLYEQVCAHLWGKGE